MTTVPREIRQRLQGSEIEELLKSGLSAVPKEAKIEPEHLIVALLREAGSPDKAAVDALLASAERHHSAYTGNGPRISDRLMKLLVDVDARAAGAPLTLAPLFATLASGTEPYVSNVRDQIARARGILDARRVREQRRLSIRAPLNLPAVEQAGQNLIDAAIAGMLDRAVGRDQEIEQTAKILVKRDVDNVLLAGKTGVGKTAIVYELANRIADGTGPVPEEIRLFSVSIGALRASLPAIAADTQKARNRPTPVRIVLLLRWLDDLITAHDSAAMIEQLASPLKVHAIQMIATIRPDNLERLKHASALLYGRFEVIEVSEPGEKLAGQMTRANLDRLELHHGVTFTEDAVDKAVKLALGTELHMPRAAINLLDSAGSWVKLHHKDSAGRASVSRLVVDADTIVAAAGRSAI